MGENGKRISTLLSELTNRNIICTRSYAMKLKGLATGERGDSLIQGICRCVWCKWFGVWAHLFWNLLWIVAIAVWHGAQLGLGIYGFKKRNGRFDSNSKALLWKADAGAASLVWERV